MALPKVASLIADRLNATAVQWMTTGSIAAMTYGEYRVTNDIDLVLILDEASVSELTNAFPLQEFYCPPAEVLREEAARPERGHFNLIHHDTAFKADIYLGGSDPLTRWALERRRRVLFGDSVLWVARPKYVIIGKLEFTAKAAAKSTSATFAECSRQRRWAVIFWNEKSPFATWQTPGAGSSL